MDPWDILFYIFTFQIYGYLYLALWTWICKMRRQLSKQHDPAKNYRAVQ